MSEITKISVKLTSFVDLHIHMERFPQKYHLFAITSCQKIKIYSNFLAEIKNNVTNCTNSCKNFQGSENSCKKRLNILTLANLSSLHKIAMEISMAI